MKLVRNLLCAATVALATPLGASAAESNASCVAWFTSTLAQAGVAGPVISSGAQTLSPFGRTVVSEEAHAERGFCPYDPNWFLS